MKKRNLRIQVRMQVFRKMSQNALNRVLIVPKDRARRMLPIPLKIMDFEKYDFPLCKNNGNLEFWSQCHILRFCNTFEIIICKFER